MLIDRDLLDEPFSGMTFGVFTSVMDICTPFRDQYLVYDVSAYHNLIGKLPNSKQRKEFNASLDQLIEEGHIKGRFISKGLYLIDCAKSFKYDLEKLPHGAAAVSYDKIRDIVRGSTNWQGLLKYYMLLAEHAKKDGKCSYSRKYFASKLKSTEATISKYNTQLRELGVLGVIQRMNMPNIYYLKY